MILAQAARRLEGLSAQILVPWPLIRRYGIAALSMKLAPGESPADVKPAGVLTYDRVFSRVEDGPVRTYRPPDWAIPAFSSA